MAKSKPEIRARAGMLEHLIRIQLSEMRRLFIEEAPHSRILSAKFVLDLQCDNLKLYMKDKDRRMGIPYHAAMTRRLQDYVTEGKAMQANSLSKYLEEQKHERVPGVDREGSTAEGGHRRRRRRVSSPVLGQPRRYVRRLEGPDSPFLQPMVGHVPPSSEEAVVEPVRRRLRVLSSSSNEDNLRQGSSIIPASDRHVGRKVGPKTRGREGHDLAGRSTTASEPLPSTSRGLGNIPGRGSDIQSGQRQLDIAPTLDSSTTDTDDSLDKTWKEYKRTKETLKKKFGTKKPKSSRK